jgi:hypothetical protein
MMAKPPHINAQFVANNLEVGDDPQSANIVRCVAAERDIAVAALRRIHENEIGFGDADMIAADALNTIGVEDADDPHEAYCEACEELNRLRAE